MKKNIFFIFLVTSISFIIFSCAPSAGNRVIQKGEIEGEFSLGGAFTYLVSIFSLPTPLPNVNLGVRYGISDDVNVVVRTQPMLIMFNSTIFETTGVFRVLKKQENYWYVPNINIHSGINWFVNWVEPGFAFYPLIGINSIWSISQHIDIYVTSEISLDLKLFKKPVDYKINIALGSTFDITENISLNPELRINSIGNLYALLNTFIGVPCVFISISYKF